MAASRTPRSDPRRARPARRAAASAPRRVGIFGGTFDPPHVGHLAIAECAREDLRLDQVVFVPSGVPPHKRAAAVSPVELRIAMTRLAVRGNPSFRVSEIEARRGGPSYTVDTLRSFRDRVPRARLFLILGEDSLDEFATWRDPAGITELATLAVAPRTLAHSAARRARALAAPARRVTWIRSPKFDVSSSAVRARARAARSLRYLVPDRVAAFIHSHRLYRSAR